MTYNTLKHEVHVY